MHKISSFVEQDDALLGVLTVRESITYALRLRYVAVSEDSTQLRLTLHS